MSLRVNSLGRSVAHAALRHSVNKSCRVRPSDWKFGAIKRLRARRDADFRTLFSVALPSLRRLEDEAEMRRRGQEVEAEDRAEAQAERRRKALAETWRGVERRWAEEAEDRRHARRRRALLPLGRLCPSPPPPFSGRRCPRHLARRARRDLARGLLEG